MTKKHQIVQKQHAGVAVHTSAIFKISKMTKKGFGADFE